MTGTARGSGLSTAVALVLVAAHGVLVLDGARRHGAVYDETVYPTAGYAYWTTGDYRMNPEHPPLLKLWTGLAWLGEDLPITEAPGWSEGLEWPWSQAVLFGSGRHESLLFRARLMVAILSMVLAWAIHTVARRRGGAHC